MRRFSALPVTATAALTLSLLCVSASAQDQQVRPHSAYQSPASLAAVSLAASTKGVPADELTTGEKTDFEKTARYQEVIDLAHLYEKRSKYIKVISYGTTPEGRPMTAIIVSKDRAFTPEAARKTGKPIIYIQSGIHSGEIEGKDTALMLVRDMAVTNHPKQAAWLDKVIFIVVPLYEIDGHEDRSEFNRAQQQGPDITGTRPQEQQLNLNRDYIKADAPETRAFLKLFNEWGPDFYFDNHVTDGADYQYDVTWDMTHHEDIGPGSRAWVNDRYIPELNKRMEADGHLVSPYGGLRGDFPGTGGAGMANAPGGAAAAGGRGGRGGAAAAAAGGGGGGDDRAGRTAPPSTNGMPDFNVEVFSPRYSHYWSGARNVPGLLVETHSLKTAKTRAWANYDIMTHSIEIVAEDPAALRKAVTDSNAADAAMAGHRDQMLYLGGKTSAASHPIMYHTLKRASQVSPITGQPVMSFTAEKSDFMVNMHDGVDTTASAPVPVGFLIPLAWKPIVDLLELQGVKVEKTTKDLSDQEFESWRFSAVKKQPTPFEGRTLTDYTITPVTEKQHMPVGSYYVPMNQERARIIMAMLHPAAPDALARWGFFDAVFAGMGRIGAGEYLSVPIATKMATDHPEMLKEFDAKVASDPAFAKDADARIRWWMSRSPYQPSMANKYPVVEVWNKNW